MPDQRTAPRTPFRSRVKITPSGGGAFNATTRDISDAGIFVFANVGLLAVGDVVDVQIQDTPMEAPVVAMLVVRRDQDGYGLNFMRE